VSNAVSAVTVEKRGKLTLTGVDIIANPGDKVEEEEKPLYEVFDRFCKGQVAVNMEDSEEAIKMRNR
jgi:hypothetical protein